MSTEIIQYVPPTIEELTKDIEGAWRDDAFKALMNQPPPDKWLKKNKFAKDALYLPIDKVEYLMDKIFRRWRVEVLHVGHAFNGVHVTIRLHYLNPVTGEWESQDGVGADEMQVKAGTSPADLANINRSALAMSIPKAKSEAIKDASHHIGRIFGRDLNRENIKEFAQSKPIMSTMQKRYLSLISTAGDIVELENLYSSASQLGDFDEAYVARKKQLAKTTAKTTRTKKGKDTP
jgi:hypothetical protein